MYFHITNMSKGEIPRQDYPCIQELLDNIEKIPVTLELIKVGLVQERTRECTTHRQIISTREQKLLEY